MLSSFVCADGDCGVLNGDSEGLTALPDALPDPVELWSGVDSGMLLVAAHNYDLYKNNLKINAIAFVTTSKFEKLYMVCEYTG